MLERKIECDNCGETYPPGWPHECESSASPTGSPVDRDHEIEGAEAFHQGYHESQNPHQKGSNEYQDWQTGWREAYEEVQLS